MILRRNSICIGNTQPHGDPGGVFVFGSVQISVEQSTNRKHELKTFKVMKDIIGP